MSACVLAFGESWPCGSCAADWMNINSLYVTAGGSVDWHRNTGTQSINAGASLSNESFKFKSGGNAFVALGAVFFYNWRVEFEAAYFRAKMKNIEWVAADGTRTSQNIGGHIEDIPLMLNAYYDIPVTEFLGLYVGAGVGASFQELHVGSYSLNGINTLAATTKKSPFAWQIKAGLAVRVYCNVSLILGYRFFGTARQHGSFSRTLADGSSIPINYTKTPYWNSLEAGIRVYF